MSVTTAIRRLVAGGLTTEQAVFAAEVCEAEIRAPDEAMEKRRAWDRERKKKIRESGKSGGNSAPYGGKSGGNVVSFSGGSPVEPVLPKVPPNNNNKPSPNPSPRILSPTPSTAKFKNQRHLFDPEPIRMLAEGWNDIAVETDDLNQITEIIPDLEKEIKSCLPLIIRNGMDAPTAIADYLARIKRSDWLMGRTGTFRLTFDFIATRKNCDKILRGNYENRTEAKAQPKFHSGYGAYNGRELSGSGKRVSEAWRGPSRD